MMHENIKKFIDGFRYDAHPMGMLLSTVGGAVDVLSGREEHLRQAIAHACRCYRLIAKMPTIAAFRVPPSACGMPYVYPDNDLSYAGNFLNMMFKMTEREVPAEPGARARARRAVHPARRSRAELQHERDARRRQLARRSVLGARPARARGALRPAARRRERSRAAHADEIGSVEQRARVHQAREERRGRAADGLRPPRLQELRPAREDHQADRLRSLRSDAARTRCSTSRSSSSGSRWRTITSSAASCIRTSTSIPASSTRRWASRSTMFPVLFAIPRTSGLARAVGRDARRRGAEDRTPAADLPRVRAARLRGDQRAVRGTAGSCSGRCAERVHDWAAGRAGWARAPATGFGVTAYPA